MKPFYDFDFHAWARPDERSLKYAAPRKADGLDRLLALTATGSAMIATLPTPDDGPAQALDEEMAAVAAAMVSRLLERRPLVADGEREARLEPHDVGVTATHRVMNAAIMRRLGPGLLQPSNGVRVDTP